MAGSKGDRCVSATCTALFCMYIVLAFWFGTSDLFVLYSGSWKMLSITWYSSTLHRPLEKFNDMHHGKMMCFSKDPAYLLNQQLAPDITEENIHSCFFDGDILYFSNRTATHHNATMCYYQGTGIISRGEIPKQASYDGDQDICYARGRSALKGKRNGEHINKSTPICAHQSYYERGMFYTDIATAAQVERADLVACIFKISKGFVIFLFLAWCLRIFVYPLLAPFCTGSDVGKLFYCVVSFSYELCTLVVSIILPFLHRSPSLVITIHYQVIIAGNVIMFVINVLVCLCIACTTICKQDMTGQPKRKKKLVRLDRIWKEPPLTPACSQSVIPEIIPLDDGRSASTDELDAVKKLVLGLWNSNRVGIGRDARGLNHRNIEIVNIRKMKTSLSHQYNARKRDIMSYVSCLPREKLELDYKEDTQPVLTMKELADNSSALKDLVNEAINEVYLFHGTRAVNIASIEDQGFDVRKSRSKFVGNGVYFAENPVKADQYTDRSADHCTMILARVLLGKTIVLKDNVFMYESQGPPCSTCLKIKCTKKHRPRRRPFDSVVLDKPLGLFREFVVYENGVAHPEFLITYKRI